MLLKIITSSSNFPPIICGLNCKHLSRKMLPSLELEIPAIAVFSADSRRDLTRTLITHHFNVMVPEQQRLLPERWWWCASWISSEGDWWSLGTIMASSPPLDPLNRSLMISETRWDASCSSLLCLISHTHTHTHQQTHAKHTIRSMCAWEHKAHIIKGGEYLDSYIWHLGYAV